MAGNNFREGLASGAKEAFCNFASNIPDYANWFYDRTHPLWLPERDRLPPDPTVGRGLVGLMCGDLPEDDFPPPPGPPFTGGQCNNVRYLVTSYIKSDNPNSPTFEGQDREDELLGPIIGMEIEVFDNGSQAVKLLHGNDPTTDSPYEKSVASGGADFTGSAIRSVERLDGLPDDCGNPDDEDNPPPTPGSNEINIDITYNNNGNNIVVPVVFGFAFAKVDINGSLTIPVDMRGANFNLSGNLNVNTGDLNFNFDGGGDGNEACCQPPDIEEPPEEEIDPPEEEEEESVIIGVVVTSTEVETGNKATRVFQEGATTIYHPRLGNVYFRVKIGDSTVWTEDIPVRVRQQYISCPVDFGAVGVIGVPAPGVNWTLSPIRRRIVETEFPD